MILIIYVYEYYKYISRITKQHLFTRDTFINNPTSQSSDNDIYVTYNLNPHNVIDYSEYYLDPPLYSKNKDIKQTAPVRTVSHIPRNRGLKTKLTDKFPKDRRKLPMDWKCQRPWYICTMPIRE